MEQKATQEKMIAEYRTWFKILPQIFKADKKLMINKGRICRGIPARIRRNAHADVWHEGDRRRRNTRPCVKKSRKNLTQKSCMDSDTL